MGGESSSLRSVNGHYRGSDRRVRHLPSSAEVPVHAPLVASALLLVGIVVVQVVAARVVPDASIVLRSLERVDIAAGALLVTAGVETFLQWRVDGRAFVWWSGAGLIALGVPGLLSVADLAGTMAMCVAASSVAAFFFIRALRTTEIDAALTMTRAIVMVGAALIATLAITVALRFGPIGITRAATVGEFALYSGLAFVFARRAGAASWLALTLFAWALSQLPWLFVHEGTQQLAGVAVLHMAAAGLAVVGAAVALHLNARVQRNVAFEAQKGRELAEDLYADTMHEVRSTVVALEGGMRTLAPEPERALATALVAELHRLRGMVEPEAEAAPHAFSLRDALVPLLTVSRAGGWPVRWSIPDDLVALGRSTDVAQIAHALLTNARRYAPNSVITVEAFAEDGYAVLRVSDRGPGVAREDRDRIFERGERAEWQVADARGLGLHSARRLARESDGELWVEPRRGGGARFVLLVPLAAAEVTAPDERLVG
jgi:signal transduction histidine kinase